MIGSLLVAAQFNQIVGLWSARSGWVIIFAIVWMIAFVIGVLLASQFHVIPFAGPLRR